MSSHHMDMEYHTYQICLCYSRLLYFEIRELLQTISRYLFVEETLQFLDAFYQDQIHHLKTSSSNHTIYLPALIAYILLEKA
ncbi:hypothetical protein D3C80_1786970 [compost metagenome]